MTNLEKYLNEARINKEAFYLPDLKKQFPLEKERIRQFLFLGLIEPIYNTQKYCSKYYAI